MIKKNKFIIKIASILAILIFCIIYFNLKINYIDISDGYVDVEGEKVLYLLHEYGDNIHMPHVNVKGTVTKIDNEVITIQISNFGKTYLSTEEVLLKNSKDFNIEVGEEIFLKFDNLNVNKNVLSYENVELYKKVDISNYVEGAKDSFFLYYNERTKVLYKIKGKKFKYKNNNYFIINGTDNKEYYENFKNEILLIEDYKTIFNNYCNALNSQETFFEIVIQDYIKE